MCVCENMKYFLTPCKFDYRETIRNTNHVESNLRGGKSNLQISDLSCGRSSDTRVRMMGKKDGDDNDE